MSDKFFIPIILGTLREGRRSENVAKYVMEQISKFSEIEAKLIDVKNVKFSFTDEGRGLAELNKDLQSDIQKSDGLIIISPEYNHGYPGSLKMMLDMFYDEYKNKPVGLIGVSAGMVGGARVITQLTTVCRELGLIVSANGIHFANVKNLFDESGKMLDSGFDERFKGFADELMWLVKTLKYGRDNL